MPLHKTSPFTPVSIIPLVLGINTRIRILRILHARRDTHAVLIVSRVLHARNPDAPALGAGARDEVVARELEVVLVVDGPAGALGAAGGAGVAGRVADYALAWEALVCIYT